MPKIQKFETITDWRWLECEITEEQAKEYRDYEEGKIDEPEWLWDLDFDLIKDKPASDDFPPYISSIMNISVGFILN